MERRDSRGKGGERVGKEKKGKERSGSVFQLGTHSSGDAVHVFPVPGPKA